MSLLTRITDWLMPSKPRKAESDTPAPRRGVSHSPTHSPSAKYDAAQTTDDNRRWWGLVDGFSANTANSPDVRRTLRNRSRYECGNNSHAHALVETRALETVGIRGPRPQLTTSAEGDWASALNQVEDLYCRHLEKINYAHKLMVAVTAYLTDGECFAVEADNPVLPKTQPQIDLRLVECDRVASTAMAGDDPLYIDGIRLDRFGNPTSYDVLRTHPGDGITLWGKSDYDRIPASKVYHLFKPTRPGQARGIPALTPSLGLYNDIRRHRQAVLRTAEAQACVFAFLKTPAPAIPGEEPEQAEAEQIDINHVTAYTLPSGYESQFAQATQPAAEFPAFRNELLREAGRALNAPEAISVGSAAGYNFSSARFDAHGWQRSIGVDRNLLEQIILTRFFWAWLAEAVLIPGYLPPLPPIETLRVVWQWVAWASVNLLQDNQANEVALRAGFTTLAKVAADMGQDWTEILRQQAREKELREELGLPVPGAVAPAAPPQQQQPGPQENKRAGEGNTDTPEDAEDTTNASD